MANDLFSKTAKYTIDTSALIEIFDGDSLASQKYTPGLWEKILELIQDGTIISHYEVLREIKREKSKGEELFEWAQANREVFKDYDPDVEGPIIRLMSGKYKGFVNGKVKSEHADPWLIAQAKFRNLTIICEEIRSNSPNPENHKIPNVCYDPLFSVPCISLVGLTAEMNWKFR